MVGKNGLSVFCLSLFLQNKPNIFSRDFMQLGLLWEETRLIKPATTRSNLPPPSPFFRRNHESPLTDITDKRVNRRGLHTGYLGFVLNRNIFISGEKRFEKVFLTTNRNMSFGNSPPLPSPPRRFPATNKTPTSDWLITLDWIKYTWRSFRIDSMSHEFPWFLASNTHCYFFVARYHMSSENVHATIPATSKMPKIRQNFEGYEHTTPAQSFNRSFVPWANKN